MKAIQTREGFLRLTGGATAATIAASLGLLDPKLVAAQGATPPAVPRNRTLNLMFGGAAGQFLDAGIGNPYANAATHQIGNATLWEPLFYYSAFANETIPWLATDSTWNEDFTELTINVRSDAVWADGQPFTARDVVFTINMLKSNAPALQYSTDIRDYVASADAPDDQTVQLVFTRPYPRFVFDYLTFKFDTGIKIVPEHVFSLVDDVTSFSFYDPDKGWPFGTGPYKITLWTPTQKFMDLRPDYWGSQVGFTPQPQVQRLIFVPFSDDNRAAQLLIANELDGALDLRPGTIKALLPQNKKIITHSFDQPPYGYVDWWPNSLWFNCDSAPWNDPDVRWAVSYAINREQMIQVGYEGAGQATQLPFPDYPALRPYFDSVADLLDRYPTNKFDLAMTGRLMTGKGYKKDRDGFWVGQDGKRIAADIIGASIWADIGPIMAEMLRRGGFEASYSMPADRSTRVPNGDAKVFPNGHGGSIADPYFTLSFFHSRNYRPSGEMISGNGFSRWRNPQFDQIVDQMAVIPMGDERLFGLFHQSMEIWLRELPNAPLIQWFHRIPMNRTYWTGYPTVENSYVNGAFWHLTFPLILHRLQPAQ